jgi:hypothetical protein
MMQWLLGLAMAGFPLWWMSHSDHEWGSMG